MMINMVNKEKYLEKKWNEIASFPAWFQKGCSNTTAEYTDKGKFIEVKNSCDKGTKKICDENSCKIVPKRKIKIGKAFPTKDENLLKVQFFPPFKAPYKVEYIEENEKGEYTNAIVGTNKKYLWILSREEQLSDEDFNRLKAIAKEKGFDVDKLVKTQKKMI